MGRGARTRARFPRDGRKTRPGFRVPKRSVLDITDTVQELYDELDFQRAAQACLWALRSSSAVASRSTSSPRRAVWVEPTDLENDIE